MSDTDETCWHRSPSGIVCDRPAAAYIDNRWLCALHAQAAKAKKWRKRK